jgi:hypothetical protein
MRRVTASALVFALTFAAPLIAARAPRGGQVQGLASIAGNATTSTGQTIANVTVQLRDLVTGSLAGTTTSSATGTFTFAGLQAGSYAAEVVSAAGQIIGTSSSIAVSAGATITGITVSASAAALAGAAGAAGAAAAAGAGAGAAVGASTAIVITSVAAAAGIAGAVAASTQTASPSR